MCRFQSTVIEHRHVTVFKLTDWQSNGVLSTQIWVSKWESNGVLSTRMWGIHVCISPLCVGSIPPLCVRGKQANKHNVCIYGCVCLVCVSDLAECVGSRSECLGMNGRLHVYLCMCVYARICVCGRLWIFSNRPALYNFGPPV